MQNCKTKRQNRMKTLMQGQTKEQNAVASAEIEKILKTELRDVINYYVGKYGRTLERKLGLRKEDLMNDMREQIWKGLLTHDPKKSAARKSYIYGLIKNRFNTLLERSNKRKYNSVEYFADIWATTGIAREYRETDETPETVFELREAMMRETYSLTAFERVVYFDLVCGRSLAEMAKRHQVDRVIVISAVNRIDRLLRGR